MVTRPLDAENLIHRLLDSADVPWRLPRLDLEKRYGIRKHPAYGWDVIEIETPHPIIGSLIYPLSVHVAPTFSPYQPATEFSSVSYVCDDERVNIQRTAEQFQHSLGPALVAPKNNTIECELAFGNAAVRLTVWPADMQFLPSPDNPSHQRDPRLARGCHIEIRTGFRPLLTPIERSWLDSFVAISPIPVTRTIALGKVYAPSGSQSELEFIREADGNPEHVFGKIGRSADGAALIFYHAQLYVIPIADVAGFETRRVQAARGPGGSTLEVECRTHYDGPPTKRLRICYGDRADDLNELTQKIATAAGKPFVLSPYFLDD